MTKSRKESMARLEARIDALNELTELMLLQVASNTDLRDLAITLERRLESLRNDTTIDPLRLEAAREAFERLRGVIRKERRL